MHVYNIIDTVNGIRLLRFSNPEVWELISFTFPRPLIQNAVVKVTVNFQENLSFKYKLDIICKEEVSSVVTETVKCNQSKLPELLTKRMIRHDYLIKLNETELKSFTGNYVKQLPSQPNLHQLITVFN